MQKYLTEHIPGTGGVIKASMDDFLVTEIPAYEPCGFGEHIYLTIEKRGATTLEAISRIARKLRIREKDIGYAGMKDSFGITRQTISAQRIRPEDAAEITLDGVRVLSAVRHTNKLRLGHLKGNRFTVVARGVSGDALEYADKVLDVLAKRGVPNCFGMQRYGVRGNSDLIGYAMARRDWKEAVDLLIGDPAEIRDEAWREAVSAYVRGAVEKSFKLMPRHCGGERDALRSLLKRPDDWEKAFAALNPRLKKIFLSACQSRLFDRVLQQRLTTIDRVMTGDVAWKHDNGACFLVDDAAAEQPRAERFEISATGPMFGSGMKQPEGRPREMEEEILAGEGISPDSLNLGVGLRMEGTRRPLRVPLTEPYLRKLGDALYLEFALPKGAYATSVMREITKTF